jgi:hypothetical protein
MGTESSRHRMVRCLTPSRSSRAGRISDLKRQVKYELIPKQDGERACYYVADFTYYENGNLVVEDCKGYQTEVFRLKKKLMLWVHGIRIRIT